MNKHLLALVVLTCVYLLWNGLIPVAWLYGDPRHVLYPRNSTGMFCGIGQNKWDLPPVVLGSSGLGLCFFDAHVCLSLRDKPSVMYFDILKCATGTNIMAAALQGLQCPTTQVQARSIQNHLRLLLVYKVSWCPWDFYISNTHNLVIFYSVVELLVWTLCLKGACLL